MGWRIEGMRCVRVCVCACAQRKARRRRKKNATRLLKGVAIVSLTNQTRRRAGQSDARVFMSSLEVHVVEVAAVWRAQQGTLALTPTRLLWVNTGVCVLPTIGEFSSVYSGISTLFGSRQASWPLARIARQRASGEASAKVRPEFP